jgi:heterotetrameric sarcosine oxidase gamma subunit
MTAAPIEGEGLRIAASPVTDLWQVACWGDLAAAGPLLDRLGLPEPDYARTAHAGGLRAWRIAPDKLLIEGAGDLSAEASDALMPLDLGHARLRVHVTGRAARRLLSQLTPIALSDDILPEGGFAQTGMHGIAVLIDRTGAEAYDVLVPGTWAASLWDLLALNARPLTGAVA